MVVRFFVVCVLALSASFFSPGRANAENVFQMHLVADPQTLDWNIATTPMETYLLMNIMEGLVEFDSKMKIKPLLAKSWTISPDQRTYTFKLRTDVKWSDGKPLRAEDFVDSWRRLLNPLTAAPYAYMLFDIEGAEDYNSRKALDFSKVAIKAIDPTTLQVRLRRPIAYFIQFLTFWVTFPVRQDVIEKYGMRWTQPGNMVVLGPFIPVSYQAGVQIVLKRNKTYAGKRPAMDTILMRIINEDSTALNLFKAGQLDFVRPINFLELGSLTSTNAFHSDPYFRTCFLNLNTTKYPLNLPKVRQAIGMAVDRSKLLKVMHHPLKETMALVPEAIFPEGKNIGLKFNPEAARKLLQEVGIDPATLPPIELMAYASDENTLLTQFVQDQLKKNLGLKTEMKTPEYKMFRQQLQLLSSGIYYNYWGADYADPDTFFGVFLSDSGNNHTAWKNAAYDELVHKAAGTPNGPARWKLYNEAQKILLEEGAPIIPLHNDSITYLLNPKFKNFVMNPLNYIYLRDITLSK